MHASFLTWGIPVLPVQWTRNTVVSSHHVLQISITEKLMLKCLSYSVPCYYGVGFFCTWEEEPWVNKYSRRNSISQKTLLLSYSDLNGIEHVVASGYTVFSKKILMKYQWQSKTASKIHSIASVKSMRAFNLFYKGMVKTGIHLILKSDVTFNLTFTVT